MSRIRIGYLRWRISYSPHADGTDRGNPRDAGELYACQITDLYQKAALVYQSGFFVLFTFLFAYAIIKIRI